MFAMKSSVLYEFSLGCLSTILWLFKYSSVLYFCSYNMVVLYAQEQCISMYDLNGQGHLVNFTSLSWKNMTLDARFFCIKYGISSQECDRLLAAHRHRCITEVCHKRFTGCTSEVRADDAFLQLTSKSPNDVESEAYHFCEQNLLVKEDCDRIIAHHRQSCTPVLLPPEKENTHLQCKTELLLLHNNNTTQVVPFSTQSFENMDMDADTFCLNYNVPVHQCEILVARHREKCINELIREAIPNYIASICSQKSQCDPDTAVQSIDQIIEVGNEKRRNQRRDSSSYNHILSVNSFDIFDTILARDVEHPQDIFSLIEDQYPFPHFRELRMLAESRADGSFDGIYRQIQSLVNLTEAETEALKQYEFATELNHTYLIRETYEQVQDGDILVSDMYLPYDHIHKLLTHAGFQKKINLYISYGGKFRGWMWSVLQNMYDIRLHVGDNFASDVIKAYEFGILSHWATIHSFTPEEVVVKNAGSKSLALLLRRFRHENPYKFGTASYKLYQAQARYNLPILLLLVVELKLIMQREGLNRLLLTTRDGCLLEKLVAFLMPEYINITTIRFHSSRYVYNHPSTEYKTYVKEVYVPGKSLIFDLYGSFDSGRALFMDVFGELPRVHLFSGRAYNDIKYNASHRYPGLSTSTIDRISIEKLNVDVVGQLVAVFYDDNMEQRRFLRVPINWYSKRDAQTIHKTIDSFCASSRRDEVVRVLQEIEHTHVSNALLDVVAYLLPPAPNYIPRGEAHDMWIHETKPLQDVSYCRFLLHHHNSTAALLASELEYLSHEDGPPLRVLLVDNEDRTTLEEWNTLIDKHKAGEDILLNGTYQNLRCRLSLYHYLNPVNVVVSPYVSKSSRMTMAEVVMSVEVEVSSNAEIVVHNKPRDVEAHTTGS